MSGLHLDNELGRFGDVPFYRAEFHGPDDARAVFFRETRRQRHLNRHSGETLLRGVPRADHAHSKPLSGNVAALAEIPREDTGTAGDGGQKQVKGLGGRGLSTIFHGLVRLNGEVPDFRMDAFAAGKVYLNDFVCHIFRQSLLTWNGYYATVADTLIVLKQALLLILALFLLGCAGGQDHALRMGLANAPASLDPRFATDATSTRINRLLYTRLVEFDAHSRPIPSLARWRRLSPRHYRFTLRGTPAPFANGAPLTSGDIKATFDFILDEANGSPHRNTLRMVERIETPDGRTVDFFLNRSDVLFPAYLGIGILPADLILKDHAFQSQPLGNGPFRLVDWPDEGRLRLERRSDGQIVEFLHVKDPTVRVLKLLRGEIDMLQNDIPPELVGFLQEKEPIRIVRTRGSNFSYLGFNLQDPATADPLVRRAIAHAIDRAAIIRHALGGFAAPAQALLPPRHWAGARDLQPYDYAPALARELLRQAGYSDSRPLRLVYKTSSDPFRVRLATIIQSQLREVGIQVALRSYDWGTFYGDIKSGRFQMYSLAWVGINTPDIFRYVFHSTSAPPDGANRGRFSSPEVDRLIENAETEDNIDLQAPLYHALQAQLLKELPYVPLWYEDQILALRQGVENYRIAGDGNYNGLILARKNAAP